MEYTFLIFFCFYFGYSFPIFGTYIDASPVNFTNVLSATADGDVILLEAENYDDLISFLDGKFISIKNA
ncbi:hypothetical protein ACT3CD_16000 [Geofilum sp. OHC36d9]|uniref:hypothetical protein n=1 Tax=Geofilum sp. OHC36d9 TaxID=3458413 RepID=UPI004033C102